MVQNSRNVFLLSRLLQTIIGMPLLLMVVKSVIELLIKLVYMQEGIVYDISVFVGHPFTALIIATLMAAYFLGTLQGI